MRHHLAKDGYLFITTFHYILIPSSNMTHVAHQSPRYYNIIFAAKDVEKEFPLGVKTNEIYDLPEGSDSFVVHQIFKLDTKGEDVFKNSSQVTFNMTFYNDTGGTKHLFELLLKKKYMVPAGWVKHKLDQVFVKQGEEDDSEWNSSDMTETDTDSESLITTDGDLHLDEETEVDTEDDEEKGPRKKIESEE